MFRIWLFVFFNLVGLSPLFAQTSGTLSGTIIDSKTKNPVPFASVFLANTMVGTNSDQNGKYQISNIPLGKYDLTVSSLGYVVRQISISVSIDPGEVNVELIPDIRYLKEVTIKSKKLNRQKWMAVFKEYFIGRVQQAPNAAECTILNPDKIDFDYDEETKLFTVSCPEPIQVQNSALGYRYYFLLQEFTLDYSKKRYLIGGIPRFEEMTPKSEGQMKKWRKERDRVYYGSLNHFMVSLIHHRLAKELFYVYSLCDGAQKGMNLDSAFSINNRSQLVAHCPLQIIYRGEAHQEISEIRLLDGVITVHENGYYEDQLRVDLEGYYGLHEKIAAESVPLEYEPIKKN